IVNNQTNITVQIIFTLRLYDLSITYSNFTTYNNVNYTKYLNYQITYRCGYLNANRNVYLLINETINRTYPLICDNQTRNIIDTINLVDGWYNIRVRLENFKNTNNQTFVFINTILMNISIKIYFGFSINHPISTASLNVYSLAPYLNCSFSDLYNLTITNYTQTYNYNYTINSSNFKVYVYCKDFYNINKTEYIYPLFYLEIYPIDEETGKYDTKLWVDSSTNKTSLVRFVAISDLFTDRYIYENLTSKIYLLLPTSNWILRLDQVYTTTYISSVYYLKEYKDTKLYVCLGPELNQITQTAYSTSPLDNYFIVERAESGCVKTISKTDNLGQYYGFTFYTLPGLYTISIINGNKTFLSAIRGEVSNNIDLNKLLYLLQQKTKEFLTFKFITIKSDANNKIITIAVKYTTDNYKLEIYKDNQLIYSRMFLDTDSFSDNILYNQFGLNETDIINIKIYKGNKLIFDKNYQVSGKEIKFDLITSIILLSFILLLTYLKPLNIRAIFIASILSLLIGSIIIYYSPSHIIINMLGLLLVLQTIIVSIIYIKANK
ncbi:MAG: hypothetical protein QXQ14_03655, partial [Candidatus Aenigmatarchaeota archaeon]